MELTIGIQNKETTEAGTLIITMNPVNTSRWISTPELIEAEIAVQPYGVISVPDYEDLAETELMCYVTLNYVTYGAGLADLIAGSIGAEITFTATGTGGGGANDEEITKKIEGSTYNLTDEKASFVGENAFAYDKLLTYIECPNASIISKSAFYSASSLLSASFPNVTIISSSAFAQCYSLATLYAPKLKTIGIGAFGSCSSLAALDLTLADDIGERAFAAAGLKEATLPLITSIPASLFSGCQSLVSVNFPEVLSAPTSSPFNHCGSLKDVSMPKLRYVAAQMFTYCTTLSEIDLPAVSSIGASAFKGCTSLETIKIGSSASTAGNLAQSIFDGCIKLRSIYLDYTNSSKFYSIGANTFTNCPIVDSSYLGVFGSIYVPESMYSLYIGNASWLNYSSRLVSY